MWCGKRVKGRQTELCRQLHFDSFHGRLRSLEAFHVIRIAGMTLLTLHADRIAFPARDCREAFHAE